MVLFYFLLSLYFPVLMRSLFQYSRFSYSFIRAKIAFLYCCFLAFSQHINMPPTQKHVTGAWDGPGSLRRLWLFWGALWGSGVKPSRALFRERTNSWQPCLQERGLHDRRPHATHRTHLRGRHSLGQSLGGSLPSSGRRGPLLTRDKLTGHVVG